MWTCKHTKFAERFHGVRLARKDAEGELATLSKPLKEKIKALQSGEVGQRVAQFKKAEEAGLEVWTKHLAPELDHDDVPELEGVSLRWLKSVEVYDPSMVPVQYLTPDLVKIKQSGEVPPGCRLIERATLVCGGK